MLYLGAATAARMKATKLVKLKIKSSDRRIIRPKPHPEGRLDPGPDCCMMQVHTQVCEGGKGRLDVIVECNSVVTRDVRSG